MLTGGRCAGGAASRPWTVALGLWKAGSESNFGIAMPNLDMKPGRSIPISKLRIVPVMTPTATGAAVLARPAFQMPGENCGSE